MSPSQEIEVPRFDMNSSQYVLTYDSLFCYPSFIFQKIISIKSKRLCLTEIIFTQKQTISCTCIVRELAIRNSYMSYQGLSNRLERLRKGTGALV